MNSSSDKYTTTEIRFLSFISQYTRDIPYIKGQQNTLFDALSHTDKTTITNDILRPDLISDKQKSETTLTEISLNTSLKLKQFPVLFSNKTIYFDTTLNTLYCFYTDETNILTST